MNDENAGFDDEHDEYDVLLAELGRTEEEDERIAVHEAGHAVAARLLGKPLGGATISPDPNGQYGGLVWGPRHSVAFGSEDDADDVPGLCDNLRDLMPQDGEARGDAADMYLHVLDRCIELAAASVAERMLLAGEPAPPLATLSKRSRLRRWSASRRKRLSVSWHSASSRRVTCYTPMAL